MNTSDFINNSHVVVKVAIFRENCYTMEEKVAIFFNIYYFSRVFVKILNIFEKVLSIFNNFPKFHYKDIRHINVRCP